MSTFIGSPRWYSLSEFDCNSIYKIVKRFYKGSIKEVELDRPENESNYYFGA